MRILVVEDDRSVRETLGMVLECYQYTVDLVEGGELALAYLGERHERDWPDVMLLDLTLIDMSGEELWSRIHKRFGKAPPTVVLSAAQNVEQRLERLPGARFLAKPYTLDQLTDAITEAAHRSRAA